MPSKDRTPWPFPTRQHRSATPEPVQPVQEKPTEEALDHGIEESFPASDPPSVTVTKVPSGGSPHVDAEPARDTAP